MASRKSARNASGRTRTAESASRAGSGNTRGRGPAATSATTVQGGKAGRSAAGGQDRTGQGTGRQGAGRNNQNGGSRGGRSQNPAAGSQARLGTATVAGPGKAALPGKAVPPPYSAPLWVQWTALVLSLGGLGMSVYLTIAHYTSTSILACSNKGYIDCAKVTTSAQSMVFGVLPVAVLGLAFYVFMTAVNTPWAWRWQQPLIPWARTAGIISGIGFVLYLIYAEIIQIGNICLLCTIVHIITFLLFVLLISVAPFFKSQAPAR